MIWLEEINPKNWRMELNVAEEQKDYVSDSFSLMKNIKETDMGLRQ